VLLLALLLGAVACQSRVALDARVERDGSGVLNVGVGLDDGALRRIGDLDRQVRVGDLAAAGWQVSRAHKEADGLTWLRASKPFRSTEDLNGVLTEVSGPPGILRDVHLVDEDVGTATIHHLAGTVDVSPGLALLADPQLAARLGADPVAGQAPGIEQAEGRPLRDLVAFDVTARLGDQGVQTVHPTLGAAPSTLDVAVREDKPVTSVGGGVPLGAILLGGGLVAAMLVAVRRRFATSPGDEPPAASPVAVGDPEPDPTVVVELAEDAGTDPGHEEAAVPAGPVLDERQAAAPGEVAAAVPPVEPGEPTAGGNGAVGTVHAGERPDGHATDRLPVPNGAADPVATDLSVAPAIEGHAAADGPVSDEATADDLVETASLAGDPGDGVGGPGDDLHTGEAPAGATP
jgi:hypothetical protein